MADRIDFNLARKLFSFERTVPIHVGMKLSLNICALLAPSIIGLSGCGGIAADDHNSNGQSNEGISLSVRYEVWIDSKADPLRPLEITQSGVLEFDGEQVSTLEIPEIASRLGIGSPAEIAVAPAKDAAFADVVTNLSAISETIRFELSGLEQHRRFLRADDSERQPIAAPDFRGDVGDYGVPVVVSYSEDTNQCIVALNGSTVSSEQLYDLSFRRLDTLVQREGGPEAIMTDPEVFEKVTAHVQAQPETPWHCVAGALYNVHASGWPLIQLEVTSE